MTIQQLRLPLVVQRATSPESNASYLAKLKSLLSSDLDFHGKNSAYASHDFHAFPAKFPPQLPRKFIEWLTDADDLVLDPMMGSGTTILEAFLLGRQGIGFDIDPLALRLCKVKVTPASLEKAAEVGHQILEQAKIKLQYDSPWLTNLLNNRFDSTTREFVDYWFLPETRLELMALIQEIEHVQDISIRAFLELAFSAIIITKSGGVSMARDLAHTRPHRVNDKIPRSAIEQYRQKLRKNIQSLAELIYGTGKVFLFEGNAQSLGLPNDSVDLIVTSPPYAANAIDYMRAHKFSLVWFGHSIKELSQLRRQYIGGEALIGCQLLDLPDYPSQVLTKVAKRDEKKARVLHRYYSEMARSLSEMYRVLKPEKAAIVVVGTSTIRGLDAETQICLGEIGESVGFDLVDIKERKLDRDKRMMPARKNTQPNSQIEERMHEEYVIGLYKPGATKGVLDDN
jgi:DNA modification methylase